MKVQKSKINYLITCCILVVICLAIIPIFANNIENVAYADNIINNVNIEQICQDFTQDIEFVIDGVSHNIEDYEKYIDDRFEPMNMGNHNENIVDEWIFSIVPIQLFENKVEDFLYIGDKYGFFFNYDKEDDTYLVYIMLHKFDDKSVSGHIIRQIIPLYYEKYVFNETNKTAALKYVVRQNTEGVTGVTITTYNYEKYSLYHNVYLKNIAFNGSLYNINNLNEGDDNYNATKDNGGYFIGGSYKFKGVSTQSGKMQFAYDMFMIALGAFGGDKIGAALTFIDILTATANGAQDAMSDFRSEITNETDYSFYVADIENDKQVEKYGHLLKDYVSVLNTPDTKEGVLFGIHRGSYAQSTFYYNFANQDEKENTGFVGKIKMDVVEENGNIIGSTVSPIAVNVESNGYGADIYDQKEIELVEDELTNIYNISNKRCPISFIAPENGIYTFETFGFVKNEFIIPFGEVKNKDEGINQQLVVKLKKGDKFNFISKNTSSENGIYQIKVMFTPEEIELNQTKCLIIKPNECEYVVYSNELGKGFNYSLNMSGEYTVCVMLGNRADIIDMRSMEYMTSNAIATGASGNYYIGIENNGSSDLEIDLTVLPILDMNIGQAIDVSLGHKAIFQISPSMSTNAVKFNVMNSEYLKMYLLDADFVNIDNTQSCLNPQLTRVLEEGKLYYILLENSNIYNNQVTLDIEYDLTKLSLGTTCITDKKYENVSYLFSLTSEAQVYFESTNGVELTIFNSELKEMYEYEGNYTIEKNKEYIVLARGGQNSFSINISICCTEDLSGVFNNSGYRYILFTPTKSDYYEVRGVSNYEFYDSLLRLHSGKMYLGDKYYLKIYGESNSDYNISIIREHQNIALRTVHGLQNGLYSINIENSGIYSISTTKAKGEAAFYDIFDSNNSIVASHIEIGEKYNVHLDADIYYLDIVSNTQIGLLINILNADDVHTNRVLLSDVEQYMLLSDISDNTYVFSAPTTGEYYFKIAYASPSLPIKITVADSELNNVNAEELQLQSFANDVLSKRVGVKINLVEGKTYYINIFYSQVISPSISIGVLISLPNIIDDVYLSDTSMIDELLIISNGKKNGVNTISMGRTYYISALGVKNIRWMLNRDSDGVCTIKGNELIVDFNSENEGKIIDIIFIDDTDELIIANVEIKFPYYAKAEFDDNDWVLKTRLVDRYGNGDSTNGIIQRTKIIIGSTNFDEVEGSEVSILPLIESAPEILCDNMEISGKVVVEYDGYYTYIVSFDKQSIKSIRLLLDSIGDNLNADGHLILDTSNTSKNNLTIKISNGVETLILIGNKNRTLQNIRFDFASNNRILIYMLNYNVNLSSEIAFQLSNIESTKVYFAGQNNINGNTSQYLIVANKVEFAGNGILNVIGGNGTNGTDGVRDGEDGSVLGDNGANGLNGESGKAGTSALYCTAISKLDIGTIKLQGGNGGNGGNGSDGGNGGGFWFDPSIDKAGGNGGYGGNGGNGGARGVGCSLEISISGITVLNGFAGCGGNGGNGGNGGLGAYSMSLSDKLTNSSIGGNGGNGGDAGNCGSGDHVCKKPIGGHGGDGGAGGSGNHYASSPPGALTISYIYMEACPGGKGGDGGKGYIGGNGGWGGDGGNGSDGGNAIMFTAAGDGKPGARGGNGGKGGNYTSSSGKAGEGGLGGTGGKGGNGGEKFAAFKAGKPGADGEDGDDGADGVYENPSSGGACIALGTLITLADGRQVPVESLTGKEMLLVWNIFTGEFDIAPILFIDKDPAREYEIINLYFSDGTSVKVIDEHGFWDYDLNQYVFLRNDASQYIGHWFNKQTMDANGNLVNTRVQLVEVVVQTEYTSAWSPVTYGHLCYYVNGMLSMPGATTGLINIFDVDPETMKIDEAKYLADIEQYGLFTYEEFARICPIPEEVFEAFGGKYLKVAIGKGLTSVEELTILVARYSQFW